MREREINHRRGLLGRQRPQRKSWYFSKYINVAFTERGNIYTLPIVSDSFTHPSSSKGRYFMLILSMRTLKLTEVKYLCGDVQLVGDGSGPLTPSPVLFHCILLPSSGGQQSFHGTHQNTCAPQSQLLLSCYLHR